MATPAQINANRINAQKSSGPKSPEGKAKSCLNHISHGFTSANLFIALEDQEEFNGLLSDLTAEFRPATPHEQILVEKMVQNHWLSLRAVRLQSIGLIATVPHGFIHKDLGVLIRYQHASERAYLKAHGELLKAQKEREKRGIGFESQKVAEAAESAPESPQKPPTTTQKTVEIPDFTPFEYKIAEELGMTVEELNRAA